MHVEVAIEIYKNLKFPKHVEPFSDLAIMKKLSNDEFVDYCANQNENIKIKSIAESMKSSYGYRYNSCNIRKKITEKQRTAIALYLLEKFESAKKAIEIVYDINEETFLKD